MTRRELWWSSGQGTCWLYGYVAIWPMCCGTWGTLSYCCIKSQDPIRKSMYTRQSKIPINVDLVLDLEEPSNLLQQRWGKLGTCSERTHRIRWIEVTSSRCWGGGRDVEQARSGLWFGAAEYSSWSFAETWWLHLGDMDVMLSRGLIAHCSHRQLWPREGSHLWAFTFKSYLQDVWTVLHSAGGEEC